MMKGKTLLIVTAAIILFSDISTGQITYGVKAGAYLSTQSEMGQLWDGKNINTGIVFGASIGYTFNDLFSMHTELNLQRNGGEYGLINESQQENTTCVFRYLTVPLLLRVTLDDEVGLTNGWSIYGYTGPYYGYLVSALDKMVSGDTTLYTNVTDCFERNDMGLIFGGGVTQQLDKGQLFVDLRYNMGLKTINNSDPYIRNKVILLTVGYSF